MTGARTALGRIAHDVGKHVARTAMNIRDGAVPDVLVDMLAADLFSLRDGERASAVLGRLTAEAGAAAAASPEVARCASLLAEADALEAALRNREPGAVARCAAIAREVHALLRQAALGPEGA